MIFGSIRFSSCILILFGALTFVGAPRSHAATYLVDDGSAEGTTGFGPGTDVVSLNSFISTAGMEVITTVQVAFGNPGHILSCSQTVANVAY
jgi:hypothetical protein